MFLNWLSYFSPNIIKDKNPIRCNSITLKGKKIDNTKQKTKLFFVCKIISLMHYKIIISFFYLGTQFCTFISFLARFTEQCTSRQKKKKILSENFSSKIDLKLDFMKKLQTEFIFY